jgi:hypothetical protein
MPAYRLRGLPQDDSARPGLLPRVEEQSVRPRVFPERAVTIGSAQVTSLTLPPPACVAQPAKSGQRLPFRAVLATPGAARHLFGVSGFFICRSLKSLVPPKG